jgi:phosphoenolpyruvate carboxylase
MHGLLPAVLAAKVAIHEQRRFQEKSGVPVYPMMGVGSLPFRGGLTPYSCKEFLKEYGGTRTVTLQSAFRYDYPTADVKKAVRYLNRELSGGTDSASASPDKGLVAELNSIFSAAYRETVEKIAPLINSVSEQIPIRRDRISHTGPMGYGRKMGRKDLPRGVKFTASLYSLGIPPEVIGTGRGLAAAASAGLLHHLKSVYLNLYSDLRSAGAYLNRENLRLLAADYPALQQVEEDATLIEETLGMELEPSGLHHFLHRNHTSNVYHLHKAGENYDKDVVAAGLARRNLG